MKEEVKERVKEMKEAVKEMKEEVKEEDGSLIGRGEYKKDSETKQHLNFVFGLQ